MGSSFHSSKCSSNCGAHCWLLVLLFTLACLISQVIGCRIYNLVTLKPTPACHTLIGCMGNSIPNVGCYYFWPETELIALAKNTLVPIHFSCLCQFSSHSFRSCHGIWTRELNNNKLQSTTSLPNCTKPLLQKQMGTLNPISYQP